LKEDESVTESPSPIIRPKFTIPDPPKIKTKMIKFSLFDFKSPSKKSIQTPVSFKTPQKRSKFLKISSLSNLISKRIQKTKKKSTISVISKIIAQKKLEQEQMSKPLITVVRKKFKVIRINDDIRFVTRLKKEMDNREIRREVEMLEN
jgi:hypothetical protein